jgi:hypothetical protein
MTERLGDQPIEPQYREFMNKLARALDTMFNGDAKGDAKQTGFCLMVFDFGIGPGRANYISNANRKDVIVLLKEQIKRFEGQPDITGHA